MDVPGEELMGYAKGYHGGPVAYDFVGYPNRDSEFFLSLLSDYSAILTCRQ